MSGSGGIDLKVAAADYSSLTLEQKHELVTEAIRRRRLYRRWHVTEARRDKKELVQNYGWSSCLNKEELMMIGDLDQEEADNLLCNQSQEEEEEDYVCLTFQHRLDRRNVHQLMAGLTVQDKASSYNEEFFVDARFNESDNDDGIGPRFVFRGYTVDLIGVDLQDYRAMMKHHPGRQRRILV